MWFAFQFDLHLHVAIGNLARCEDGKWRSIANSGRDLYRHVAAADAFFKARVRALSAERSGVRRDYREQARSWEVEGVPEEVRDAFSRRSSAVTAVVGEEADRTEQQRHAGLAALRRGLAAQPVRLEEAGEVVRVVALQPVNLDERALPARRDPGH